MIELGFILLALGVLGGAIFGISPYRAIMSESGKNGSKRRKRRSSKSRKNEAEDGRQRYRVEIDHLAAEEKRLLFKIGSSPNRPKVEEIFPQFERGSEEHGWLHTLRERELIAPVEGGRFRASKHVQLEARGRELFEEHRQELANQGSAAQPDG